MRPTPLSTGLLVLAVCALGGCTKGAARQRLVVGFTENPLQIGHAGPDVLPPRPLGLGGYRPRGDEAYYRVSKTDTFTTIAIKFYGHARYYSELFFANEGRLAEAGGLKRGLIIVLPTMADGARPRTPTARP